MSLAQHHLQVREEDKMSGSMTRAQGTSASSSDRNAGKGYSRITKFHAASRYSNPIAHFDSKVTLPEACQADFNAFKAGPAGLFDDHQTKKDGKGIPGTGRCNLVTCELPAENNQKPGGACTVAKNAESAAKVIDTCIAQQLLALQDESNKDDAKLTEARLNVVRGAQGLLKHGCTEQLCTQICKYPPFGSANNQPAPGGAKRGCATLIGLALGLAFLCT